jgi:Tfp pilus assembly protein PilF
MRVFDQSDGFGASPHNRTVNSRIGEGAPELTWYEHPDQPKLRRAMSNSFQSSALRASAPLGVAVIACAMALGCAAHSGGATGSSYTPDRQSEAEYDLARDAWIRRGDAREGLAHALKATEIDDENAEAHHLVALLYLDLCQKLAQDCRLADAEREAGRALKLRGDFREARNTLGVVLIHEHQYKQAIEILEPLTKDILYTSPESAWGNLGWAYLEVGKLDESRDALLRSIAAQPRFCVGHYRLGLVYERLGHAEAAVESFSNALQADSRCSGLQDALLHRAKAHLSLGQKAPAQIDLSRCAQLSLSTLTGKECESIRLKIK